MKDNRYLTVLTDGGKEIGFGHITRCIALSKAFEKKGFEIEFVVYGDSSVKSILNYKTNIFNWHKDHKKLFTFLRSNTLLLVDSLSVLDELLLELEQKNSLIFIDDEKRRNIINKGFVLDWTILSDEREYFLPRKKNVVYLLGSRYTPLREEFYSVKTKKIIKNVESIMVTFGGSDVRNLTPKILSFLTQNYPNIVKNVIIGAGFQNLKEIKQIADMNTNLILNADAKRVVDVMLKSDICIGSGGQTLYELAYIGVPTIGILLVENAKDDTLGWRDVGFLEYIGRYDDIKLLTNLKTAINKIMNKNIRKKLQRSAQNYIFSNGADLIVEAVLEHL